MSKVNLKIEEGKRSTKNNCYAQAKCAGIYCVNFHCRFYDNTGTYEQNCIAGDSDDNPFLPVCDKYIPADRQRTELPRTKPEKKQGVKPEKKQGVKGTSETACYTIEEGYYRERKSPTVAFRWFGTNEGHARQARMVLEQFCGYGFFVTLGTNGDLTIKNKYGFLEVVSTGCWVVADKNGEITTMTDDIFALKYEAV